MKELTIEQKARAYDEDIEKLRNAFYGNNRRMCEEYRQAVIRIIEHIFPELKKPEDEEIRKGLIENFKWFCGDYPETAKWGKDDNLLVKDIIAWLEKQGKVPVTINIDKMVEDYANNEDCDNEGFGKPVNCMIRAYYQGLTDAIATVMLEKQDEQKPQGKSALEAIKEEKVDNANKVEPKFKAGNWYQCTKDFFGKGVTFDKNTAYYCAQEGCLQNEYGCHIAIVKDLYDNFKLWTIQDAKDGDVLAVEPIEGYPNPFIAIYKERGLDFFNSYCFIGFDGNFYKGDVGHSIENIHPATKEQCNTLMKAMADAGWEFDFEKKELKKIENETEIPFGAKDSKLQEATYFIPKGFHAEIDDDKVVIKKGEKPTAWSENDEYIIERLSYLLDNEQENYPHLSCDFQEIQEFKDWLKSLKQRIKL